MTTSAFHSPDTNSAEYSLGCAFKSDCQMFRVDNNLYAGCQAHQIIRIGHKDTIRRSHRHPRTADPRCRAKFQNCRHADLPPPILWEHHAGWRIPPAKVEPTGKTSRGKRGRGFFSFACASIAGEFRRRAYNCASSFRSFGSPDEYSFPCRFHASVESSPPCAPCAAIAPAAEGLPLRIHSKMTPISAPMAGPTT